MLGYKPNWLGVVFQGAINKADFIPLATKIVDPFCVLVKIYDKNNNLKYLFYANVDFSNQIEKFELEINKNGYGLGIVEFAEKTPIYVESEDIFVFYNNDKVIYKGFAATDLDTYKKEVYLYPFSKRLQEWHYSGSFSNKTIKNILYTILTLFENKTNIHYNENNLQIDNTEVFTVTYENESLFDIINKLVEYLTDSYWFIDENNILNVKKIKKETINYFFMLNTDNRYYEKISLTFDYKSIEATEYKVYKKDSTTNKLIYINKVGNVGNSTYPPLQILEKTREIEGIFNSPEAVINDNTALSFAYANLKSKAKIKQNININNVNLFKYTPKIDDYIYFEYIRGYNFDDYIRAATLSTQVYENFDSINKKTTIKAEININTQETLYINFIEYTKNDLSRSDIYIKILHSDIENIKLYENTTLIYDKNVTLNEIINFSCDNLITKIEVTTKTTTNITKDSALFEFLIKIFANLIKVDFVVDNVTKIKYKLSENGLTCNFQCGDLLDEEGEELLKLKKKVKILENIAKI